MRKGISNDHFWIINEHLFHNSVPCAREALAGSFFNLSGIIIVLVVALLF
jgi:hypothetical protein